MVKSKQGGQSTVKSILSVLLAVLIVGQAFTAPVAASTTTDKAQQCGKIDSIVYDMMHGVNLLASESDADDHILTGTDDDDHPCSTQYQVDQAIRDMQESDAEQTETSIYTSAANQKSLSKVGVTVRDNYVETSKTFVWTRAENVTANKYENGSTRTAAHIAVNTTIEDYYAQQQLNLIKQWNASVAAYETLDNQATAEDGINDSYVYPSGQDIREDYNITVVSTTLANGSTVHVKSIDIEETTGAQEPAPAPWKGDLEEDSSVPIEGLYVAPPSDDYDRIELVDFSAYKSQWDKISSASGEVKAEYDVYFDRTWTALENDRIQPRDVTSKVTKVYQYGTEAAGNSTSLYDAVAALSSLGLDTPNMSGTGMMTVEYTTSTGATATKTGIVMAHTAPDGQWRTDTQYNASNISGAVWIAGSEGESVKLTDEFVITEMTSKSGESIASVNTTQYNTRTVQIDALQDELERLTELYNEIEEREPDPSAGGGDSGSKYPFGLSGAEFVLVVGGAVLGVYFLKDLLLGVLGVYKP